MGCDYRNISRVIVWGLSLTFCGFVQEAGRAARDLDTQGEAIMIIPQSVMKENVSNSPAEINSIFELEVAEPETIEHNEVTEDVDEEGIRQEKSTAPAKRLKRFGKETNIHERRALLLYAQTKLCRRIIWNRFFQNSKKPHIDQETMYAVVTTGLKRGKKKKVPDEEAAYIRKKLTEWRDTILFGKVYPGITSLSGSLILSDKTIATISTCGHRLESVCDYTTLCAHVRWNRGHNEETGGPNELGRMLIQQLEVIYEVLDQQNQPIEARKHLQRKQQQPTSTNSLKWKKPKTAHVFSDALPQVPLIWCTVATEFNMNTIYESDESGNMSDSS
ncbi:hypothetical protein JR316_0011789 [Psilocybe cubensis]|nr:hypothetical protein JR316_0011789 [Psilocybe cubensis]KAH9476218.1 hypothetical protein JR316_0011789 [Psilocybe cubensis]